MVFLTGGVVQLPIGLPCVTCVSTCVSGHLWITRCHGSKDVEIRSEREVVLASHEIP